MSFSVTNNQIIHGDSLEKLKQLEDESIDCIVTDPPYGYSFMNKDWDKAVVSVDVWKECLRVMKSGAFAFIMSSPRQDVLCKMILNLIDAGFETNFTSIYWTYASGFPKAANVSKLVDKRNGTTADESQQFAEYIKAKRLELGISLSKMDNDVCNGTTNYTWFEGRPTGQRLPKPKEYSKIKSILKLDNRFDEFIGEAEREIIGEQKQKGNIGYEHEDYHFEPKTRYITKSATEQAKKLDGSYAGFQPKPALETILVVMKPLSEKSFVDQALKNGKGITWLDNCRIPFKDEKDFEYTKAGNLRHKKGWSSNGSNEGWKRDSHNDYNVPLPIEKGRFPANLIVSDDSLNDGKIRKSTKSHGFKGKVFDPAKGWNNNHMIRHESFIEDSGSYSRYFDLDAWFLAIPKASASERNKGLENEQPKQVRPEDGSWKSLDIFSNRYNEQKDNRGKVPLHQNNHPTVKPIKLMSYLITMGSRENDIILDPFCGSGTTCIAAYQLHRKFIGIEINKEYVDIANKRLEPYQKQTKLLG